MYFVTSVFMLFHLCDIHEPIPEILFLFDPPVELHVVVEVQPFHFLGFEVVMVLNFLAIPF